MNSTSRLFEMKRLVVICAIVIDAVLFDCKE